MAVAAGLVRGSSVWSRRWRRFPSGSLAAAFHGGSFGVTPHTYAESGQVFRRFAAAAGLQHPTILTPDVGGLALCCDEFRLVDLALLSNRKLAHGARGASARSSTPSRPTWSRRTGIGPPLGGSTSCPSSGPATCRRSRGGTKLWLRRDVAASASRASGRGCWLAADSGDVQAGAADPSLRESRPARGQKQLRACRGRLRAQRGRAAPRREPAAGLLRTREREVEQSVAAHVVAPHEPQEPRAERHQLVVQGDERRPDPAALEGVQVGVPLAAP